MTKEERDQKLHQMVRDYQTELLRLCYCWLQDKSMAEDAVQETFIKVYRKLDMLRPECNEKAWIYKIAVNCSRDINRSSWYKRMDRHCLPDMIPQAGETVSDDLISLNNAINSLKLKQREVILLHYYQRFSVNEIADILGLSQSSVSGRLQRAKKQLFRMLQE